MGKLFNLKAWLTVVDAARHLSIVFGEEVTEADVLQLALDGHLKLSVNFVNHAVARCGKVIPLSQAKIVPIMGRNVVLALQLNDRDFLELDEKIATLADVWDLPLIGNERLDVEHKYQNLTDGPAVTLQGLDGAFVKGQDGQLCQLQESFDDNEHQAGSEAHLRKLKEHIARDNIGSSKAQELLDQYKEKREKFLKERKAKKDSGNDSENYYPAGGLPQDSVLVVRTDALREFEQSINGAPAIEIFKNDEGYVPLVANLEGRYEKSFEMLPDELKPLVERAFFVMPWDSLDVENRRSRAAGYDYKNDPNHEPATYFELIAFSEELKVWIATARKESNDAKVVALLDVADRMEKILDVDRERVGLEIQELRAMKQAEKDNSRESTKADKPVSTREKRTLLTIIAALCGNARIDYTARGASQRIKEATEAIGAPIDDGTIAKVISAIPDALETRTK